MGRIEDHGDSPEHLEDGIVLVCGLGRLGQHCARALNEFGVAIHAIEAQKRHHWALPQVPALIDRLVIGDCRLPGVLEQAEIGRCRAILLVTGDERSNIVTAFAARSLNPQVRVVLCSAQENLNALLCRTLGNFVAFEPTQLSINAFALAGVGDETAGLFSVDDHRIPVLRRVSIVCGGLLIGLYLTGALLYRLHYLAITLRDALNVPLVLLLGGYDNLFGQLTMHFPIPVWLHLFSLGLTVAGTLSLGIVYATLTEQVVSARFRFSQQRPPPPKADHVVLVGLGRVGRQCRRMC